MRVSVYTYIYMYVYICVRVYMYICMHAYMYAFIYIYMCVCVCVCVCVCRAIGLMSRVFANSHWDLGSIPGQVIPKTQKAVLDAAFLNTQH